MALNNPTVPQPYVPQEFPKWITVAGKQVLVNSREEELQHLPQAPDAGSAPEIIEVALPTPPAAPPVHPVEVKAPPAVKVEPAVVKTAVKAPPKPVPVPLPLKAPPKPKPKAGKRK